MTFSVKCVDASEQEVLHDALAFNISEMDILTEKLMDMSDSTWKAMMTRRGVLMPKGFGREDHVEQVAEGRGRLRRLQRIIDDAPRCD